MSRDYTMDMVVPEDYDPQPKYVREFHPPEQKEFKLLYNHFVTFCEYIQAKRTGNLAKMRQASKRLREEHAALNRFYNGSDGTGAKPGRPKRKNGTDTGIFAVHGTNKEARP